MDPPTSGDMGKGTAPGGAPPPQPLTMSGGNTTTNTSTGGQSSSSSSKPQTSVVSFVPLVRLSSNSTKLIFNTSASILASS